MVQMEQIQLVLEKLDEQGRRLQQIEAAVVQIAVQDEKIINIQQQLSTLWEKYDKFHGPEGVVTKIRNHQASCPRGQMKMIWSAIVVIATGVIVRFLTG